MNSKSFFWKVNTYFHKPKKKKRKITLSDRSFGRYILQNMQNLQKLLPVHAYYDVYFLSVWLFFFFLPCLQYKSVAFTTIHHIASSGHKKKKKDRDSQFFFYIETLVRIGSFVRFLFFFGNVQPEMYTFKKSNLSL